MNDINLKIVKEYVDKKVAGTLTGKSAYQIAVDNGFVGTEQEWLAEIKNYEGLNNKPSINNVTLSGNKSSDDLNLQGKLTTGNNITIENNVISAEGGVTDYAQLSNLPKIVYRKSAHILMSGDLNGKLRSQGGIYFTKSDDGYDIQVDPKTVFTVRRYDKTTINDLFEGESFVLACNTFIDLPNFANRNSILVQYADKASTVDNSCNCVQFLYWRDSIGKLHTAQRINTKSTFGTWEEVSSGATIVSGVVNVNGTITFTDSEGNSFTTSGSNLVTSGNEQIGMGYDEGGFYFLFDDGQEGE